MSIRRSIDRRDVWLGALTALCAPLAYAVMFSGFGGFQPYDDEGYFTLAIKQVLGGAPLYHDVLAQHGPFFFEFWNTAFGFGVLDVSTNHARILVIGLWLAIALICGLATLRFTDRLAAAATVLLAVVVLNEHLAPEPTHPGSLIELLLALVALTMAARIGSTRKWAVAGALAGLLIMVKINIGGLAAIGLLFAGACACAPTRRARWLQIGAGGLLVVVPFLLTAPDLGHTGVEVLSLVIALSAAAVVVVVFPRSDATGLSIRVTVLPLVIGAAGAVAASALMAWVAYGADPALVFNEVVVKAADQRNVLARLIDMRVELLDLALATFAVVVALRRTGTLGLLAASDHPAIAAGRLLAGLVIVLSVIGGSPVTFGLNASVFGVAAPLAWVAVLPRPGVKATAAAGRAGLVAVAVLQPLHAYPVAGSQLVFGSILLMIVGGICLADGVALLERRATASPGRDVLRFAAVAAAGLVIVLGAKIGLEQVALQTRSQYRVLDGLPTLPFDGADHVHLSADQVQTYTALIEAIRARCSTLQTLPGMSSLNLWSAVDPPTGLNAPSWPYLLNDMQQRRVVVAMQADRRPCLIRNDSILGSLTGRPLPDRPLLRYLSTGWTTQLDVGGYQLQTRANE